jgi:hypothetical protein
LVFGSTEWLIKTNSCESTFNLRLAGFHIHTVPEIALSRRSAQAILMKASQFSTFLHQRVAILRRLANHPNVLWVLANPVLAGPISIFKIYFSDRFLIIPIASHHLLQPVSSPPGQPDSAVGRDGGL